jgi:imidazolonepropionase-like amidohydrolase
VSSDSVSGRKYNSAVKNFQSLYKRAKKIGVKMTFSTDLFSSMAMQSQQPLEFTARAPYFTPYEILVQATSNGAELLGYSGKLHPYRDGPLGVIQEGAYADMLIVDGNSLEDISILTKPDENLALIMKDGKIYKNTIK